MSQLHIYFPKRVFLTPNRVFWVTVRENWFTVWAVVLLKNKQNVTGPVGPVVPTWCLDRSWVRTKFGWAAWWPPNVITHPKYDIDIGKYCQIDIKLWLWRRIEITCFSTTTADAINTAKPCRATCYFIVYFVVKSTMLTSEKIMEYSSAMTYLHVQDAKTTPLKPSHRINLGLIIIF